jgi:hypothetical protein
LEVLVEEHEDETGPGVLIVGDVLDAVLVRGGELVRIRVGRGEDRGDLGRQGRGGGAEYAGPRDGEEDCFWGYIRRCDLSICQYICESQGVPVVKHSPIPLPALRDLRSVTWMLGWNVAPGKPVNQSKNAFERVSNS